MVEHIFAVAAREAGIASNCHWMIERPDQFERAISAPAKPARLTDAGASLREVYDAYMSDPTRDWSPRTRLAYETTRRLALAIFGENTPIQRINRARCRKFIEALRWMPRNASKRFPDQTPLELAEAAKSAQATDVISPANINTYLNKLSGLFNWALNEQLIDRNPATGLKVPDPTLPRDKRLPFSMPQLQSIFCAPLYTGCLDDRHGYAMVGSNRPRNARFWIPLIGLFNGLRLNEACQLDVADIVVVEDILCFAITASGGSLPNDKRLKTASSERLTPVHPKLIALGFKGFVAERSRCGESKLFYEVTLGATGYRSATFSAWFARFSAKAGASTRTTCFHSFRHSFRDALREARVERDLAMALGGWSQASSSASVSDAYGSGYRVGILFDAISLVVYPKLDLSHL
jgi:integrase